MFFFRDRCFSFFKFFKDVISFRPVLSFISNELSSSTWIWHLLSSSSFFSEYMACSSSICISSSIKVLHEQVYCSDSISEWRPWTSKLLHLRSKYLILLQVTRPDAIWIIPASSIPQHDKVSSFKIWFPASISPIKLAYFSWKTTNLILKALILLLLLMAYMTVRIASNLNLQFSNVIYFSEHFYTLIASLNFSAKV